MFGFGKKIEIEIPDGKGGIKKVKVSEKQFDQWIAEGKISPVEGCKAHISDPMKGIYEENWVIGEQISKDMYEKFKDENGDIYVDVFYKEGEQNVHIVNKDFWFLVQKIVDEKVADIMEARKLAKDEDKPEVLHKFEQTEELLESCSEAEKYAAGNTINSIWKMFIVNFGNAENFQKLSDAEKTEFLQKMSDMQLHIIEEELQEKAPPGSVHGACLVVFYILAIALNEGAGVINYMADVLEKYGLMSYESTQS